MSIFGIDPAEVERIRERHIMYGELFKRNMKNFFEGASVDDMMAIHALLGSLTNNEDPMPMVHYWQGVFAANIETRYSVCASCGVDHDADDIADMEKVNKHMRELVHGTVKPVADEAQDEPDEKPKDEAEDDDEEAPFPAGVWFIPTAEEGHVIFDHQYANEAVDWLDKSNKTAHPGTSEPLSGLQASLLYTYNLDDLRQDETNELMGFVCTKCGLQYSTIQDRMLREPDECHGCHQKAKFG